MPDPGAMHYTMMRKIFRDVLKVRPGRWGITLGVAAIEGCGIPGEEMRVVAFEFLQHTVLPGKKVVVQCRE